MREKATRDTRRISPMPVEVAVLEYTATFSSEQMELIARGYIPHSQDEKWFMYAEGNPLWLHRSWSGFCIYRVDFERAGDGAHVTRALANRNPEQYNNSDDAYDVALLDFLICNLLPGQAKPFPATGSVPKEWPPGLEQHIAAGTAYLERKVRVKRWWQFWK